MNDIKSVVAKNIAALRLENEMTQLELAERLNYSDKAISKWEHGESLPDISVLVEISKLFGVTLDYIVSPEHEEQEQPQTIQSRAIYIRTIITAISIMFVWLVAVGVFVLNSIFVGYSHQWLAFIYAAVVSTIVWLVLNSVWFNTRRNYLIITILMWSALAAIHITFIAFSINIWPVYLVGIPGQIIVILCSAFSKKPRRKKR